jgi:hypothetical protein
MNQIHEEQHLAEADQHIADAERRLTEQEQRLIAQEAAGANTTESKKLLVNFRNTLAEMHIHRRLILDELSRR